MKTKNKILSAVLATSLAIGALQMTPIKTLAATGDVTENVNDRVVAKKNVSKKKYKTGEVVIPFEFGHLKDIGFRKSGLCLVSKEGEYQFINKKGETLFYTNTYNLGSAKFHSIKEDDKYGMEDNNGNVVISVIYDDIYYGEGLFCVKKGDKWGYVNIKEEEVIPIQYDKASSFSDGLGRVEKDGKIMYVNKDGEEFIISEYETGSFKKGLAEVEIDGKKGLINKQGEIVIAPKYDYIIIDDNGLIEVGRKKKQGIINRQGKVVLPIKYDFITAQYDWNSSRDGNEYNSDGGFLINLGNKWGFANKKGKIITQIKYDHVEEFVDGVAMVRKNNKYTYIDTRGKEMMPFQDRVDGYELNTHALAYSYKDNRFVVTKNGKYGFANRKGKIVIPAKYEAYMTFNQGLAPVCLNGKWGYINTDGKVVIPFKYEIARSFSQGLAAVMLNGKWGFISR